MSSGVFRPYNLTDVLSTLNQQSTALTGSAQMITTLGAFAEADENLGLVDSVALFKVTQSAQGYDEGWNWGGITWN